jgi:peptidoglycan hydrolase CwlO-like protein
MIQFFLTWILIGVASLGGFYLYSRVLFFKTLYKELLQENIQLKHGLTENNAMLDSYEFAVSKNSSNLSFLEQELADALGNIKMLKEKNASLKKENDELEAQLKETKQKFENLF